LLKIGAPPVIAFVALYVLVERAIGPSVQPFPATLPHVLRRPAPVATDHDSAANAINPDEEVRRLHALGITGRHWV
jgi:hypothetical protein